MLLSQLLLYLLLGALVGLLGSIFGIGGGVIVVPLLVLLFGYSQQLAQGTGMITVIFNIMLSLYLYNRHNKINIHYALSLSLPSFLCAFGGAQIALYLDTQQMQNIFAIFLLCLAGYTIWREFIYRQVTQNKLTFDYHLIWFMILGGACGFLGGIFGVGSGLVATPILVLGFGLSQVIAQSLSLCIALPSLISTLSMYVMHGQVNWLASIFLTLGGFITVSFGVKLAHTMPQRVLKTLFGLFLILCSLLLIIK